MFTAMFWILAVWFIVNVIWMWFVTDNANMEKTFAWINVVAIIVGFWVYFGATRTAGIDTWFNVLNYANIIVAIIQFYYGYRGANHSTHQA
ncbi:hypothetical protein [Companilactobacillus mishanensis]|uniref:Nicotinamide mononucleotide transporter n=1 Tax=Companilactobacillus mishanensis TaxID=2486008 RepID=A0A5P0ZJH3_9LACO|nr:hypothetical protein [Companilactobacillus mishanensis]MQS45317.1 hypothetical protein [Companilactobacillus mishanensis]MQS53261.1 hypothetical protein [Companilactobacillus mishanensis]MQS90053.1 hypothetical protein [Companilactobacillus mishanensis]